MRFRRKRLPWRPAAWWLSVALAALTLKWHYSVATAAELEWMFRPLAGLLEWLSGHAFHRDSHFEWVSESADVRLVKACAGINFMLMSFLVYAWNFRPVCENNSGVRAWIMRRALLLVAAAVAAWGTCLLANSLRIMTAMTAATQPWNLTAVGIDAGEFHRLIGMAIYVPLLALQMLLGDARNVRNALAMPVLLYLLLMVIVPLLTGNAWQHPHLYLEHLLDISLMAALMCCLYIMWRYRQSVIRSRRHDEPLPALRLSTSPDSCQQ